MQEEESFIEAYLMELEAEKEVELEEDNDEYNETVEKSEAEDKSEADVEPESEEDIEEVQEPELAEEPNLLPARGTCRRKPLRNCYREEKGVQRNSWRKEKRKWRLS